MPPLTRRNALRLAAVGMTLPLAASSRAVGPPAAVLSGTFLQIWAADLKRPIPSWRESLYLTRLLGCTEVTIQWLRYGPDPGSYDLPDALLGPLLDYAAANSIGVRLGLPYDHRFWDVLAGRTLIDIPEFLKYAADACAGFVASCRWSRHGAFAGWYLPYEIEQFSWRYSGDAARLVDFLAAVADSVGKQTLVPLTVSTFSSKLADGQTLAVLWGDILERVRIRPLVQDGVGSTGLAGYAALRPLFAELRRREADFDVVVELFTELKEDSMDGAGFAAVSATYDRVRAQIAAAAASGAERLLGFAIDPYMLGGRAGARRLLDDYRAGLNARSQPTPGSAMLPGS